MKAIILVFLVTTVAGQKLKLSTDTLDFISHGPNFKIVTDGGVEKLKGKWSLLEEEFEDCSTENEICLKSESGNNIKVKKHEKDFSCLEVTIISAPGLPVCFDYGDDQWFGGPERYNQLWPIQNLVIKNEAYITKSSDNQAVLEAYWLSSSGSSIYVPIDNALFVDSNNIINNSLCFYGNDTDPYYTSPDDSGNLYFILCSYNDSRQAQEQAIEQYFGHPTEPIDKIMSHEPIWSTWARYKSSINSTIVLDFANEITSKGFNNSQVEIDDLWEPCYGMLDFDKNKFSNITELIDTLHDKGYRATLWIHPFINTDCQPIYNESVAEGRLILNNEGSPLTTWWNGKGGHVDFSNATTRDWFISRLEFLRSEYGIDSFKFDAGEFSWLPQSPVLNSSIKYPDEYGVYYVEMAEQLGNAVEVRIGRKTQTKIVFVRMIDKDSRWGFDNGLQSLVTTLLQFNIIGYSYVLPDMVGGNAYGVTPDKNLYIRWMQANIFMPAIQFSIVPWDFDSETEAIAHDVLNLRAKYYHFIDEAVQNYTLTGAPINPPVWWLSPDNEDALKINDEYLLGDKLLVAPVLTDSLKRDIFLPSGLWLNANSPSEVAIVGPTWLRDVNVPLNTVPVYENIA